MYAAYMTGRELVFPVYKSRSHLDGEQASAEEEKEQQQHAEGREVTSIWRVHLRSCLLGDT